MADSHEYDFFAALKDRTFRIQFVSRLVELRLTDVTPLPPPRSASKGGESVPAPHSGRAQPFQILFKGPADVRIAQGTYPMTVEAVPERLEIFIVPVARDADGYTYEAIFS